MNQDFLSTPSLSFDPFQSYDRNAPGSEKKEKVLQDFESLFVSTLLKQARSSGDEEGLIPKSPGRDLVEGMFDSMLGEELAKNGGIGLAEVIRESLFPKKDPEASSEEPKNES